MLKIEYKHKVLAIECNGKRNAYIKLKTLFMSDYVQIDLEQMDEFEIVFKNGEFDFIDVIIESDNYLFLGRDGTAVIELY